MCVCACLISLPYAAGLRACCDAACFQELAANVDTGVVLHGCVFDLIVGLLHWDILDLYFTV